jgi:hypothetical protein
VFALGRGKGPRYSYFGAEAVTRVSVTFSDAQKLTSHGFGPKNLTAPAPPPPTWKPNRAGLPDGAKVSH